ncbi:hypothetical protein OS493_031357 [Desmophyllum pertusum]|uniref:Uncharacterized protein n=1 Tax=Desmophyllum pertusum TaxID=174260 RepID=A0A9X0CHZ8_9CNID|nr:hypothetical protein OS493_031357 [Desmophyllum pertusum]
MGRECELQPPKLEHFDAWGQRVDNIQTCQGWQQLHDVSAEEGLISIPYERKYGQWSRIYQAAKLFMFSPSSGLYSCPLAMTDGAAKSIEVSDLTEKLSVLQDAYSHLTSRDPKEFWTSGQWMTERKGGSDVANGTETLAVPQEDGTYRLYGYKWFSSATDADMTLTLARVQNPDGSTVPGTKGLTMFYLQTRNEDGKLNDFEVQRLKNKLGTRQLPTAELLLHGSLAHKVETRAGFLLTMEVGRLLGKQECNEASDVELQLLRLITPITKLYTAKQSMQVTSEGLESFGGQGYIEDTG